MLVLLALNGDNFGMKNIEKSGMITLNRPHHEAISYNKEIIASSNQAGLESPKVFKEICE
jgi:hypothetical protein